MPVLLPLHQTSPPQPRVALTRCVTKSPLSLLSAQVGGPLPWTHSVLVLLARDTSLPDPLCWGALK